MDVNANNGSGSNSNVPQPRMDKEQLLLGLAQIMDQVQQGQHPTQVMPVQAQDVAANKSDTSMEVLPPAPINKTMVLRNKTRKVRTKKRKVPYQKQGNDSMLHQMPQEEITHNTRANYGAQDSQEAQHERNDPAMLAMTKVQPQGQVKMMESQAISNRQSIKARGACYYCREEGHVIRHCPLKVEHRQEKKASKQSRSQATQRL